MAGPTVPYLILMLKSIKQGRPDVAIHENVTDFPWKEVFTVLQGASTESKLVLKLVIL